MESNCNFCIKKDVCKFVEKMDKFAEGMNDMFEYPEWNKLDEVLKTNNKSCKHFLSKRTLRF